MAQALLGFCVLLFWRANAIGLTDFATREPWGVFVCPTVSPARFSHSLCLEPRNDTGTKPWKKDRAKVDVATERILLPSKIPKILEMFRSCCETRLEERKGEEKKLLREKEVLWIIWRNFAKVTFIPELMMEKERIYQEERRKIRWNLWRLS